MREDVNNTSDFQVEQLIQRVETQRSDTLHNWESVIQNNCNERTQTFVG